MARVRDKNIELRVLGVLIAVPGQSVHRLVNPPQVGPTWRKNSQLSDSITDEGGREDCESQTRRDHLLQVRRGDANKERQDREGHVER